MTLITPITPRAQTPRFRSTAAFAARSRAHGPAIERATFVTFTVGAHRFALAVESVERVLRLHADAGDSPTHVAHAGRDIPLADLAFALGASAARGSLARVLVVTVPGGWIGVLVDQVHEIATVDASGITPVDPDAPEAAIPGVRGRFVRQDHEAFVLDIARALGFRHA